MWRRISLWQISVALGRGGCVWWQDPHSRSFLLRTRAGSLFTARFNQGVLLRRFEDGRRLKESEMAD
jgi:hypothetical protein